MLCFFRNLLTWINKKFNLVADTRQVVMTDKELEEFQDFPTYARGQIIDIEKSMVDPELNIVNILDRKGENNES